MCLFSSCKSAWTRENPNPLSEASRQISHWFFKELPSLSLKVTLPDTDSSSSEVILFGILGNSKIIHATSLQSFHPVLVFLVLFIFLTPPPTPPPRRCCAYLRGGGTKRPQTFSHSSQQCPQHSLPAPSPETIPLGHAANPWLISVAMCVSSEEGMKWITHVPLPFPMCLLVFSIVEFLFTLERSPRQNLFLLFEGSVNPSISTLREEAWNVSPTRLFSS